MRRYAGLLVILSALLAAGCGGPQYTPPDLSGYVWPRPPEKARVKLVKVIATDLDIRERTTSAVLFGEEVTFRFKKPFGIAVDREDNIYVSDTFKNAIFVINAEKGTIGQLFNPYGWAKPGGIAIDDENGLMAATNGSTVLVFDLKDKKILSLIPGFIRPIGLAFDPARETLYISDTKKNEVYAYDYTFKRKATIATAEELFFPTDIDTDNEGNLYIVDSMHWKVKLYGPDGKFIRDFGEHGDRPGFFARPKGIAVSKDGYLLVTDAAFGNFQIFDKEGRPYLYVGRPGRGYGMFNIPQGVFVDKNDKIYVVDSVNRRLQIFQLMTDSYYAAHPEEGSGKK